jgi:hypothetical protein
MNAGGSINRFIIIGSIEEFPPSYFKVIEIQIILILSLIQREKIEEEFLSVVCFAFTRLFVESRTKSVKREIPDQLYHELIHVFKEILLKYPDIGNGILKKYRSNRLSFNKIKQILQ